MPQFRAERKLLRAVADLHTRGFQRLRIYPCVGGPGALRCTIAPARYFSSRHGALLSNDMPEMHAAHYSQASGNEYWGWEDRAHCTPGRLADVFLERFTEIAKLGYGQDWLYVGWFQHMLHLTYPNSLPVAAQDYFDERDYLLVSPDDQRHIVLPPPGYADDAWPAKELHVAG